MIQAPLAFPLGFLSFQVELGGHQLHELLLVKEAMNTLGLVHTIPCLFQGGENIITFLFFLSLISPKDTKVELIYKYYLICCVTE